MKDEPMTQEKEPLTQLEVGERTSPTRLVFGVGIGIIVTLIGCAYYLGLKIGVVDTKLDFMTAAITQTSKDSKELGERMKQHEATDSKAWDEYRAANNDLRTRVQLLEQSGSQATRDLAKELNNYKIENEVWKATTGKKP